MGGGVLLYSDHNLPITANYIFDDGTCQALCAHFDTVNICILNIYRPATSNSSFREVMDFIKSCVINLDDSVIVYLTGDFNFPNICWDTYSVNPGGTSEAASSPNLLLSFINDNLMIQCVEVPTRKQSILDLFITNRPNDVTQVSTEETLLSDHLFADVLLSHNPSCGPQKLKKSIDGNSFRCLDFDSDLSDLKSALMCIDWNSIRDSYTFQEFPHIFTKTLLDTCQAHVPGKKLPRGRPRALNALRRWNNLNFAESMCR